MAQTRHLPGSPRLQERYRWAVCKAPVEHGDPRAELVPLSSPAACPALTWVRSSWLELWGQLAHLNQRCFDERDVSCTDRRLQSAVAHPRMLAQAPTCHPSTAQVRASPGITVPPSFLPSLHRKLSTGMSGWPVLPHVSGSPHTAPPKTSDPPPPPQATGCSSGIGAWHAGCQHLSITLSLVCPPGKLKSRIFKESSSCGELLSILGASAEECVAHRWVTGSPTALGEPETHCKGAPHGFTHRCPPSGAHP